MAQITPITSIDMNGNLIEVTSLPKEIQQVISDWNEWRQDLENQRLEFRKTEVTVNVVGQQIVEMVKQHLNPEEPASPEAEAQASA